MAIYLDVPDGKPVAVGSLLLLELALEGPKNILKMFRKISFKEMIRKYWIQYIIGQHTILVPWQKPLLDLLFS